MNDASALRLLVAQDNRNTYTALLNSAALMCISKEIGAWVAPRAADLGRYRRAALAAGMGAPS